MLIFFKHRKVKAKSKIECDYCKEQILFYSKLLMIFKEEGLSHKNRDYINVKVCSCCLGELKEKHSLFNLKNKENSSCYLL